LSVATTYADSPLNRERGDFASLAASPGVAAPDGRFEDGYFVDRLQGDFTVAWFGGEGPSLQHRTLFIPRSGNETLFERYGVRDTATYVFRPDGHVLARCTGVDAAFAREAITAVLHYSISTAPREPEMKTQSASTPQAELDQIYDALAALVDLTPRDQRERVLARLVVTLAQELGNPAKTRQAIEQARSGH
jgi:hypothetical protein